MPLSGSWRRDGLHLHRQVGLRKIEVSHLIQVNRASRKGCLFMEKASFVSDDQSLGRGNIDGVQEADDDEIIGVESLLAMRH